MNSPSTFSKRKPGTPQVPWAVATMTYLYQLLCELAQDQSPEEFMLSAGMCSAPCVQHTASINYGSTFFVGIRQSFVSQPAPTFFPEMPANEIAAQWHAIFSQETSAAPVKKSWALGNSIPITTWRHRRATSDPERHEVGWRNETWLSSPLWVLNPGTAFFEELSYEKAFTDLWGKWTKSKEEYRTSFTLMELLK